MTRISLLSILCQSSSPEELETTARELGCTGLAWRYGALHLCLPDGLQGSLRASHARGLGISPEWVWCGHQDAE